MGQRYSSILFRAALVEIVEGARCLSLVSGCLVLAIGPNLGETICHVKLEPGGGGGYSQKNWIGMCGPLPKTPTLFMSKICDFPYPIYDLTKNLIPYL